MGPNGVAVRDWLLEVADGGPLHVVRTLTHLEVVSALRRLAAGGQVDDDLAGHAVRRFTAMPARHHEITQSMIGRVWELRHRLTAYDATYVALVERLQSSTLDEVVLCTADLRLARTPGLSIRIEPPPEL